MQKIVLIVVVIVLGLLAYNYFTTGELSLMPSGASSSDEGQELNRLRGEFRAAAREFRQAGRSAGLSGMDTTDEAAAALEAVERVETQVESLAKRTEDADLRAEAEKLLEEIRKYKRDIS